MTTLKATESYVSHEDLLGAILSSVTKKYDTIIADINAINANLSGTTQTDTKPETGVT